MSDDIKRRLDELYGNLEPLPPTPTSPPEKPIAGNPPPSNVLKKIMDRFEARKKAYEREMARLVGGGADYSSQVEWETLMRRVGRR